GLDYRDWNPETDRLIPARFSEKELKGKPLCKRHLIGEFGLPAAAMERPLFGIVSRLTGQKGMDLIAEIAGEFETLDAYLVVLGSGEPEYEEAFLKMQDGFPGRIAVRIGFDNGMAHRIEAGADAFLMPSAYEPCGLNQIYSLRYGTVPVVRATGGLDDTIEEGTGFKFSGYSAESLLAAVHAVVKAYQDLLHWRETMRRGMRKDF